MRLIGQTPVCKVCFDDINAISLFSIFNKLNICSKCNKTLSPCFETFKIGEITALSLFEYDEIFKDLIYKFKGCYDIELKSIFLGKFTRELNLMFKGYVMIPAPSYDDDNLTRGFNHVEEIFKCLNLKLENHFCKVGKFKQAEHNFQERKNIKNYIQIGNDNFKKEKYLLVDDIYTTGATIKRMIDLLKERNIKDIKVLVVCKTKSK